MSKSRRHIWLALIALPPCLLFVAYLALTAYINATNTPLHPNTQDVTSITDWTPLPKWTAAVQQGRQIARAGLAGQNLPGLSVAVGAGGDLVWAEGFGWADLERRVTVAPGMRFRIGHTSTALTSAAVGLLLDQGRLHLDDEIQNYVTAYPRKQWPVTLRQLMGHVAGVRHYRGEEDYMPSAHCERASQGLKGFAGDPLRFQPETQYHYSTYGWVLVSAAVEAAAEEPFFTFMHAQIFKPLGMVDTTSDFATDPIPDQVTFYYPRFKADTRYGPEPATVVDYSCFAGAGAFLSTPSDLVRFGIALGGGKLLRPSTVTMLQASQQLASGQETGSGLGWKLETVPLSGEPARLAGQEGGILLGGSTSLLMFPERGLVVAVTSNISFADTRSLALKIAQAFAEQTRAPTRK